MNVMLNALVISATVLGSGMALPQARQLARTRRTDGVSPTWVGVSMALNGWWLAYGFAARRPPEGAAFGEGAIEGVIAPSAANNATLGGSLIPALALGIPGGVMSALLLSALIMKGLVPGPTMLVPESQGGHLTLAFTFVWLLVVANVLAVALALIATKALVRITRVPGARMVPFLLALILVGAFADRQSAVDLLLTAAVGGLGVAMVRFEWPRAPMLMGLVPIWTPPEIVTFALLTPLT